MKLLAILVVIALTAVEGQNELREIQACGSTLHYTLVAACKQEKDFRSMKKLLLHLMSHPSDISESEGQDLNKMPSNARQEGIVEACCFKSCPYSELISYCYMANGFF